MSGLPACPHCGVQYRWGLSVSGPQEGIVEMGCIVPGPEPVHWECPGCRKPIVIIGPASKEELLEGLAPRIEAPPEE